VNRQKQVAVRLLEPANLNKDLNKEDQEKIEANQEQKYQQLSKRVFFHTLNKSKRKLWNMKNALNKI
jgi:hypothetical protein